MKTRDLGKTGIKVSEIAFGGVEIGMPYGIGVHSSADMLSRDKAIQLLHRSVDEGINFFDTARLYGESEAIMGEAFHDRRDRVVLSTKCTHFIGKDGNIPPDGQLKQIIETSLNESLSYLKTDYVDVFMLHQSPMELLDNDEVQGIFRSLKTSGKVRAIGASTYTADETKKAIEKGWDVIQLPFNMMDQRHEQHFNLANTHGTGIVIRSVLMKGLLSDRGKNLHTALQDVEEHIKKYQSLVTDDDIASLATRFALAFEQVSSVLVGIDHNEYLDKALSVLFNEALSQPIIEKAKQLAYPEPEFLDLPRWDRMGWLK